MKLNLRLKFTSLTVLLFALCFAIIIAANTGFNKLYYCQDTYQELAWLAENHPLDRDISSSGDKLGFDMTYYGYNPIYCMLFDESGKLELTHILGGDNPKQLPDTLAQQMIDAAENKWICWPYVFYRGAADDGTIIIASNVTSEYDKDELISKLLLAIGALILIALISYFLSGYVVAPTELALAREKQLISDASHELKTPVASVHVNLQALSTEGIQSKYLNNAIKETDRMSRLIHQMLTLSRAERQDNFTDFKNFSLAMCVERALLTHELIAWDKGITMESDIDDDIEFNGNESDIETVLSILIDNAIKYTPSEGHILLTLKRNGKRNIITVSDTGIGIPADDVPHIFERFYISDKSRSSESIGLGLAIAYAIVTRHGGTIAVASEQGVGSTFKVTL